MWILVYLFDIQLFDYILISDKPVELFYILMRKAAD